MDCTMQSTCTVPVLLAQIAKTNMIEEMVGHGYTSFKGIVHSNSWMVIHNVFNWVVYKSGTTEEEGTVSFMLEKTTL